MHGDFDQLNSVREKLNAVSPSFCPAKWLQASLHLETGRGHSCCLTPAKKLERGEVEADPAALHNGRENLAQRKMMLQGERPAGCEICWQVEDLPGAPFSDRVLRGTETWAAHESIGGAEVSGSEFQFDLQSQMQLLHTGGEFELAGRSAKARCLSVVVLVVARSSLVAQDRPDSAVGRR